MGRRIRHVYAGRGEWVKVHRPRRRDSLDGWGWIGIAIFLLFLIRGC